MTYPGPLTSRFPSSQLAQQLTHQAWENIGLPPPPSPTRSISRDDIDCVNYGNVETVAEEECVADPPLRHTGGGPAERNDPIQDDEVEDVVEQIASVLEYRLAEIVKGRKEEDEPGRTTPTSGVPRRRLSNEEYARRLSNEGVVRRRTSNESYDRARRRCSNDSVCSVGSAGSNRSGASRIRRRHSTSSVDVIYVSPMCRAELRQYVRIIGRRYRSCRYHSLRHAAHVALSANKLLDLLEERMLTPEEYDCCTYSPETEQIYDCASDSIELDHKFQRELRRLSIASRASGRRGSSVNDSAGGRRRSSVSAGGGGRRGSNLSSSTGTTGAGTGMGRRGSNASGLGMGMGSALGTGMFSRRSTLDSSTSFTGAGAGAYRRRSSAAGVAAIRRGSMSSIMSVAVSEADVDSVLSPSVVSDTSSRQEQRRRATRDHVQTEQGVNLRPGQLPVRRNSTGSHDSGGASSQCSGSPDAKEPKISTAAARATRRPSLSSAASSSVASSGAGSASPEGRGRHRRRHSVHGASRDVWESCSSHGTEKQQAEDNTTVSDADADCNESSHRDTFDADGSFGFIPDDPDSELNPRPHRSSTFGIATDPLIKFCLVYAALIHDVDHEGIPNRQLSRESHPLALLYNDKSAAEQNSLKVAFSTLMDPRFAELRHTLCPTSEDQFEFRRIVIDLVMCTDIASPERMQITKSKWAEAFGTRSVKRPSDDGFNMVASTTPASTSSSEAIATVTASRPRLSVRRNSIGTNPTRQYTRRAKDGGKLGIKRALHLKGSTIEFYSTAGDTDDPEAVEVRLRSSTVMELMMNAADVAHTLQSFDNFVKWNKRLYEELHEAYEIGRCADGEEDDPSKDWFGNQLGFYEIYILPLARKLRKCGAFAPDAGEAFVQNAKNICRRWEYEGAAITDRMIEEVKREYDERTSGRAAAAQDPPQANEVEGKKLSIGSCGSEDHSIPLTSLETAGRKKSSSTIESDC